MEQKIKAQEPSIVITIDHRAKRSMVAKLLTLLVFTLFFSYSQSQQAAKLSEKLARISLDKCAQEVCLTEVTAYYDLLSTKKADAAWPQSLPIMMLGLFVCLGLYEFVVLVMELILRKILK